MKNAVSNIAWSSEQDAAMYRQLQALGIRGLEAAPTRFFPEQPYSLEHCRQAEKLREHLKRAYGLSVISLQSIWYGRQEQLFRSAEERAILLDYTKRAIDFADSLHCPNLVFGSPRNRVGGGRHLEEAREFFRAVGEYAHAHGTVVAIEPNPAIYQTDFLTTTQEALRFVRALDAPGIAVNLDIGTMVANGESVDAWMGVQQWIHHVHISEPYLAEIVPRALHGEVCRRLENMGYRGYVSLEMKQSSKPAAWSTSLQYVLGIRKSKGKASHEAG